MLYIYTFFPYFLRIIVQISPRQGALICSREGLTPTQLFKSANGLPPSVPGAAVSDAAWKAPHAASQGARGGAGSDL